MKKFLFILMAIIALGAATFSSFKGGAGNGKFVAQVGTTLWAIEGASTGESFTKMFQSAGGDMVIFMRALPDKGQWVVAGIRSLLPSAETTADLFVNSTAGKGIMVPAGEMQTFEKMLLEKGWTVATPATIPGVIRSAIVAIRSSAAVREVMGNMTTVIILPAITVDQMQQYVYPVTTQQ